VTDRRVVSFSPLDRETRSIHLTRITPERATRLVPTDMAPYVTVEPVDPNNRRHIRITAPHSLVDRIVADIQRADMRPRQMLLDARVMAMSHHDLLSLGIGWAEPALLADAPSDSAPGSGEKTGDDAIKNIRVGYVQHRAATDSLYARLYELSGYGQAEYLSSPQMLAQDGRRCQLKLISDEWFFMVDPSESRYLIQRNELTKIVADTCLSITPRVSDHNDITLEMSLEVRDSLAKNQDSAFPAVMRRVAQNVVTIADGGTVVWAGLGRSGIEQEKKRAPTFGEHLLGPLFRSNDKDKTPREIVIFVTAHLIRNL
jgi:type II secretory pathway component GspD/PulD (secretin)